MANSNPKPRYEIAIGYFKEITFNDDGCENMTVNVDDRHGYTGIEFCTLETSNDMWGYSRITVDEWEVLKNFIDGIILQITNN